MSVGFSKTSITLWYILHMASIDILFFLNKIQLSLFMLKKIIPFHRLQNKGSQDLVTYFSLVSVVYSKGTYAAKVLVASQTY